MKHIVYCLYDKITNMYEHICPFPNEEMAVGTYRRMFRDYYSKGEISEDALKDYMVIGLAYFDSKTGAFESIDKDDWRVIQAWALAKDLVIGRNEDEIPN